MRARYYNPVLGRFMREDVYQGDGLNLYAYCRNNPVVYYDPSGYAKKNGNTNKAGCYIDDKINGDGNDKEGTERKQKKPKSGTGKEKADDVPSWAKGNRPYEDENGKAFAKRLCDKQFGVGNYQTKGQTDYSRIRKWGDRGFE